MAKATRPPTGSAEKCKRGTHLWVIAIRPGERVTCRICGTPRRGKRLSY